MMNLMAMVLLTVFDWKRVFHEDLFLRSFSLASELSW